MCELLGLCFNKPVRPKISFRGFRRRGRRNPHGWGLAFYPDESAQVLKEPIESTESPLSKFIVSYDLIKSKIFIAHVRLKSSGRRSYKNTHPFSRELNEKDYIFAHNGTISVESLELGRFKPVGETDSEHVFCHILHCIEERGIERWRISDFKWLHEKFREINELGEFNCLMSDGTHLFAYHDVDGYNGLCFVRREPPFGVVELRDEDFVIDLVDLAEKKDPSQRGYVIASKPLTNEDWQKFEPGGLLVFRDGEIIYPAFGDVELEILRVVRKSPRRVPLGSIIKSLDYSEEQIKSALRSLIDRGYLRQDRRDTVNWDDYGATFFTNPRKRGVIDELLRG